MNRKSVIIVSIFLFFLLTFPGLSGCANLSMTKPTATQTALPTIRPPKPTRTPTRLPSLTATPTDTPTITPTATLLPPPDDFSKARLYSSGPKPGWDFSLTIQLPEEIKGEYIAKVGDPAKTFPCRQLTEYALPDRLYCVGRQPGADKNVIFTIVEKSTDQVVFKGFVYLPLP